MQPEVLIELVKVLLLLSLVAGACGAFVASLVGDVVRELVELVLRRLRPPSPAQLQVMARVMRTRAAQLEIQAEKQLALAKK
jgi:uncharacterized protein involved in cysteine biosynthesis